MEEELTKEKCIELLRLKYEETSKEKRFPRKTDFSSREVMYIKSFLGPWPRALELSGIKPPSDNSTHSKTVEKRIRAKRKANSEIRNIKNQKEKIS